METTYLPLTEYSNKYKVSISTLRRKIKTSEINFRFDQGKYFVLDQSVTANYVRPSLHSSSEPSPSLSKAEQEFLPSPTASSNGRHSEEPVLTAANKLLTELKAAYTRILQEKEEQILHLKEEVSDLKTLVRVLESDNERLNKKAGAKA